MLSLKGFLLIAVPQLADPNFTRSVVLLLEHNDSGALGVVLNRASGTTVHDVWANVGEMPSDCTEPIHVGGPVVGPLLALHNAQRLSEAEIVPGVHLATNRDRLDALVRDSDAEFRLFSGYAGWGGGQLEQELDDGGWITRQATSDYIFCHEEDLWRKIGQDVTKEVLAPVLKSTSVPSDPSLN